MSTPEPEHGTSDARGTHGDAPPPEVHSPAVPAPPPGESMVEPGGMAARLRRLGGESLVYGLSTILGRFLSYLLTPFYAYHFTTGENGIQVLAFGIGSLVGVLFILGMDVAFMRSVAAVEEEEADRIRARQRAFSMSFAAVLLLGTAAGALGLLASPWVSRTFDLPDPIVRYLLAIVFTDALLAVPMANLRMTGRALRYAVLRLGFVGTSLLLNVALIGGLGWGIEAIFFANLVANLVLLAALLAEIARLFRPRLLLGSLPRWRALWSYALPLVPATLAVLLVERADLIVLQRFVSPELSQRLYGLSPMQVVGSYGFNYKLGVVMLLVVQMFRMAWTPFSLQQARHPDAPHLFARVLTALMLLCALVFLATTVFLPAVVSVPAVHRFPREPEYWEGVRIVPVVLLGYVFSGVYAVVSAGLFIRRRTGILPWIAGAGAAVNVAVCIVAAQRWGMVGVAWATPIAYGLMAGLGAWQANRVFPVPYEWGRLLRLAAIVAALVLVDAGAGVWIQAPASPAGWAVKSAIVLAFPVILRVSGFFRPTELQALRAMLRRQG